MANKIQLKLVKSSLETVRDDFTAIVVNSGTIGLDELLARAAEKEPNFSVTSIGLAFASWMRYTATQIGEGMFVNFGGIGLMAYVPGSLLHMDEAVSSDRLGVQVTMYENAFTEAIAKLEATTSVDEDALSFVFKKVEDETTNTLGVVTPGGTIKVLGDRLSTGLDGEKVTITDSTGATMEAANVVGDAEGCWLKGDAARKLKPGKGEVAVYCRGLKTPEADVVRQTRKVTILEANIEPGPHIESLKSRATRGEGEWRVFADVFDIEGYGFDEDTTATLRLVKRATGQEAAKVNSQTSGYNVLKRESDEKLVFTIDRNSSAEPDGSWLDDVTYDAELVLTNLKGTTKLVLNRVED